MEHKCALKAEETILDNLKWYEKIRLISSDNPLGLSYFRSDVSVREEQQRHWKVNKHAIHPFSKFRAWYEMYLIALYTSVLLTKPVDAGFMQVATKNHLVKYRYYIMVTDLLCWIDIGFNFVTGFEVPKSKIIELRQWNIAKNYMLGPFFVFDVLSSFPKSMVNFYTGPKTSIYRHFIGVLNVFCLLKFARIFSYIKCIKRAAEYFRIASKGVLFLICSMLFSALIIHWMACLQFVVPVLIRKAFSPSLGNSSWFHGDDEYTNLYPKGVLLQYSHCLFKSSAYILGIRIDLYKMAQPEDFLLAIFTYFVGKILIAFIWIILAVAILNSRLMDIKFLEIMNQLEEYMSQKQLPLNLRDRILQYFIFKYRNRFFKEELITSLLSENLRREASLHVCKLLVKNVTLFNELSPIEISKVVDYLIPEIFMPNDIIIHAGTHGEAMYFLSSGTVAVYTRSGREVCHLQDGAYFGEISLLLKGQLRITTVVALETSHVYRLNKRDLDRCLLINKTVKHKLLKCAEARLKETTKIEEEYKEVLFEQSFRKIRITQ